MKYRSSAFAPVLTLAAALVLTAAAPEPVPLPELNQKVLAFARAKLGTSVGDGSCITLAIAALKDAGARPFPMGERDGDFIWGEPVGSFKEAFPGDILQFRNAVFRGKRYLSRTRSTTWHQEYPHHTAIVSRVNPGGTEVAMLHQNVTMHGKAKDARNVQETDLPVDSLQSGWVRIYRPVGLGREAAGRDGF